MKIVTLSVQIVRLDCEGVPVLDKLMTLREQISKMKVKLMKLWKLYAETQSEATMALIELYKDVLKDYEEELDYLINGLEEE